MIKHSNKMPLFRSICTHLSSCFNPISEHCHPLGWRCLKKYLISEHCHPKSKCIHLVIFLFRSMCTQLLGSTAFRSIATQFTACIFYICASIMIDNKLAHNNMAGKLTDMSKLKQVLQLHESGLSNRSIASQLGLYKETVNKYIRQFKALSFEVKELLQKDDPKLERLFNGGSPAYVDKRFDNFSKRLHYLEAKLNRKHVTRLLLWEEYIAEYSGDCGSILFCFHLNQRAIVRPLYRLGGHACQGVFQRGACSHGHTGAKQRLLKTSCP